DLVASAAEPGDSLIVIESPGSEHYPRGHRVFQVILRRSGLILPAGTGPVCVEQNSQGALVHVQDLMRCGEDGADRRRAGRALVPARRARAVVRTAPSAPRLIPSRAAASPCVPSQVAPPSAPPRSASRSRR